MDFRHPSLRSPQDRRAADKMSVVRLRRHLQAAALNNIMGSVYRWRFDICGQSKFIISMAEDPVAMIFDDIYYDL